MRLSDEISVQSCRTVFGLCLSAVVFLAVHAAEAAVVSPVLDALSIADQVFVGRVLATADELVTLESGCGQAAAGQLPMSVLTLQAMDVWTGALESDTVTVKCIKTTMADGEVRRGDSILVWGARYCPDQWTIWCAIARVDHAGKLVGPTTERGVYVVENNVKRAAGRVEARH